MEDPYFSIIVAATPEGGIGYKGGLPWGPIKGDLKHFQSVTTHASPGKKNALIMGRRTWYSLKGVLKNRIHVVLTSEPESVSYPINVCRTKELNTALQYLKQQPEVENIFVIGGSQLYEEAMKHPLCKTIYYTRVMKNANDQSFECDTFIDDPANDDNYQLVESGPIVHDNDECSFQICVYEKKEKGKVIEIVVDKIEQPNYSGIGFSERPWMQSPESHIGHDRQLPDIKKNNLCIIPHPEQQYLDIIRELLSIKEKDINPETNTFRPDRTGIGTLSTFGVRMKFSLRDNVFPLLTTKSVHFKSVAKELLWFLSGSTNAKQLHDQGVKIWDKHGSREYFDSLNQPTREENDLGPIYSHQWRHFGAPYTGMHSDYKGQGVDQIAQIIHTLKTNPMDRGIILSAWNPVDIPTMALRPCHVMAQFYVGENVDKHGKEMRRTLSCQMYQRSGDLGLGVPFNIASYSLLTIMLAHVCNFDPGDFIHIIGDAHIYSNHVEALKIQVQREPKPFPTLMINKSRNITSIDDFCFEDFELHNYQCHPKIQMDMAV